MQSVERKLHVAKKSPLNRKVRMVFGASAKSHPLAISINDCIFTGPALQPLLWDITIETCMSQNVFVGDLEKAFLQVSVKEGDRDLLFNVN